MEALRRVGTIIKRALEITFSVLFWAVLAVWIISMIDINKIVPALEVGLVVGLLCMMISEAARGR